MAKFKSTKMNLEGWELKKWAVGNYKTIKELIKVGVPYIISTYLTGDPVLSLAMTAIGKLALDTLEYWYTENSY